ncbi:MAG TPA: DUF2846 domain-containing protein [Sphingomicrobium sp.]|nr:DUF2846 domain-containing protein [Sphingomicrobium sp.]
MRKLMFVLAAATALTAVPAIAGDTAKVPVTISAPAAGQGQVVFFRPGKFVGSAIRCTVREDGKMLGRAGNGHYFVVSAAPGAHRYTTKTEATDTLNVEVEPDETTYVKCSIGMGVMAGRPNLSPATPEDFGQVAHKIKPTDMADIAKDIAKDDAERASKAPAAAAASN